MKFRKAKRKKKTNLEILKHVKKLNREEELELFNGFPNHHKIQKSKKTYNRKLKHKKDVDNH